MGVKVIAGAALLALAAPGAAVLGVATLVAPTAAGSAGCLWDSEATDSVEVAETVPTSLTATNATGASITLNHQQLTRAATIIAVGDSENVPARGQLIAVMTAITESSLRVLSNVGAYPHSALLPNDGDGADHDSVGMFQQRPAAGWGSVEDLMNPLWSARAFYGGPTGPNHGSPRGLLDIDDWQEMDPGAAAQAVQVSAYPDRYAVNRPIAEKILAVLAGVGLASGLACADSGGERPGELPGDLLPGFPGALIAAAASQLGKPYVWGGGTFTGPTGGGFDCSGLVLYAAYQASGGRIRLPHYSGSQIHAGRGIGWADKQPGDLIFFSYPGAGGPHHVAIYVGGDRILQAPHTGDVVRYGTTGEFVGQVMTVRRLG
ncbi:C40 family peptidase [Nocardioides hankookensis]|uniref:C40 family peptidase n=1 Tax=Nocardioides hankookensis TaxID=443157 RepID=A0ABW1LMW0_9ACTN